MYFYFLFFKNNITNVKKYGITNPTLPHQLINVILNHLNVKYWLFKLYFHLKKMCELHFQFQ